MGGNAKVTVEEIIPPEPLSPPDQTRYADELWTEAALGLAEQSSVRRQAMLEGCKWDPQVGDTSTLAAFPVVMPRRVWNKLARQAEQLTAEAFAAEAEIVRRPELHARLGLPKALQQVMVADAPRPPAAGRVIRFDFHPTSEGWRISEANSDVPGGFAEGSHFTQLMAGHYPHLQIAGDPAAAWSKVLADTVGPGGMIALLSATGFMEDHQVIAFLAERLREQGCRTHLARPDQIYWHNGVARLDTPWYRGPLAAIWRFYQAEWLTRLPKTSGWNCFFRGGKTPVANPAMAVISESKRFPLVWDQLAAKLPTWRALLPETCDIREGSWIKDDGWLLKTAYCNTGDTVSARAWLPPRKWLQVWWNARLFPANWVLQKRFESKPLLTPVGWRHPCVGIYTVNGRAAGAYARLSEKPLIDFRAVDAALLLKDDE